MAHSVIRHNLRIQVRDTYGNASGLLTILTLKSLFHLGWDAVCREVESDMRQNGLRTLDTFSLRYNRDPTCNCYNLRRSQKGECRCHRRRISVPRCRLNLSGRHRSWNEITPAIWVLWTDCVKAVTVTPCSGSDRLCSIIYWDLGH